MAKYDELMEEYLKDHGIDSPRTLARALTAVRDVATRKKKRQRWLRNIATGCSLLGFVLLLLAWRIWVQNQFANDNTGKLLGFARHTGHMHLMATMVCAALLGAVALAVWLTILLRNWQNARRLARIETSLPNPGQVLKQVQGAK